ncbi:MAG: SDR family oxidoreductase [Gammaproteobacteria bacterium]|nr:SDR family oxidoreductase [Gammaproteobacteria bacterium]MBU1968058.1 SDR family oxidoreductase [Gammaproteobacteria bacterium]
MKVVLSGASSGIGLALARHYLERGATIAAFARRGELLQSLAAEFPGRVFPYALDVRDGPAIQQAAADFMARFGVPDIVIANAGVSIGTLTRHVEDNEVFQHVMDINVLGAVKTFQPFIHAMREAASSNPSPQSSPASGRGGNREKQFTLVGIASVAGFRGLSGSGAYSASKAALISYMESLRVEMHGSGVRVVTVCPGYIRTPMTDINPYPMPFMLEVDDAARRISRVIDRGSSFAVVPWQMALVGRLLKLLPNWLYDELFSRTPHKPRK